MKKSTIGIIAGSVAVIAIAGAVFASKKKKATVSQSIAKLINSDSSISNQNVDDAIKDAVNTMTLYMARTDTTNDSIFLDDTTMWLQCSILTARNKQKYMHVKPSESTGLGGGTIVVGEKAAVIWGLYPTPIEAEAASSEWMACHSWIFKKPDQAASN